MPFSQNTEIKMYYELDGSGDKVLFISGTGGDLRVKPNVLDGPLPGSYTTLAFDQRGLGQTEKPIDEYSMEQYADDAASLMDEVGWETAHVVGVSFGGMVAMHFAIRHSCRISKLVLCCTSPGGASMASYPLHEIPADTDDAEKIRFMMGIGDMRFDADWQKANQKQVEEIVQQSLKVLHPDQSLAETRAGSIRQLEARSHHDVVDNLKDITMPTLICAGRYDGLAPTKNQQAMCDRIPDAKISWFEGGHMFLIQDKTAWEKIISFLGDSAQDSLDH
jgi:3-oxoadipate enol-lactonase|tara:strand:+ start:3309 stop:4139 length:831 start_codon:yes stop_codon:yes gene_type:complete